MFTNVVVMDAIENRSTDDNWGARFSLGFSSLLNWRSRHVCACVLEEICRLFDLFFIRNFST